MSVNWNNVLKNQMNGMDAFSAYNAENIDTDYADYTEPVFKKEIRCLDAYDVNKLHPFFAEYVKDGDWRVSLDIDEVEAMAEEETGYYIGVFENEHLVGIISMGGADGIINGASGKDAFISDLYVIPQRRGSGLGAELVQTALDRAKDEYGGKVYAVMPDDTLADYFDNFGFKDAGNGLISVSCEPVVKDRPKPVRSDYGLD